VKKKQDRKVIRALSMLTQFTLFLLVPILGMGGAGLLLDRELGTRWIAIVLFFMGAIAGFNNVYRFAMTIIQGEGSSEKPDESESVSEKKE
jgi:F0F1-type ATP synthase assembly protein I